MLRWTQTNWVEIKCQAEVVVFGCNSAFLLPRDSWADSSVLRVALHSSICVLSAAYP